MTIPNKLYHNRPRAAGQVYKPAIEVDDLEWSTAAFRKVVEADVRANRRAHRAGSRSAARAGGAS